MNKNKYLETENILLKQGKFNISLELNRIEKVLNLLDNPQDKLKIIHVAGTNGKGSVCAMLNQILIEAGFNAGLYTSPHLIKYNERIKINGKDISDNDFYELTCFIVDIAEKHNIKLTEFEILTAVMYKYFADKKVDFAIIEVGLGGRFDATNVIKSPLLSIITSISYDHTERLGSTIEKIAFEKAGIIKNNCPVIFDKENLGANSIEKTAKERLSKIYYPHKAEIIFDNKNYIKYDSEIYELGLLGKYQAKNGALAICASRILNIDEKFLKKGLQNVKWNCRFQYFKDRNIIIDGCHNPDGAKKLKESLDLYFPDLNRIFVYTSLKNKDFVTVQKSLFSKKDIIYHFNMKNKRFLNFSNVKNATKSLDIKGLEELINKKEQKELLIICGSLYAIGDILSKIKICNF